MEKIDWAHETRKEIVVEMLRVDQKLMCWLKALLKIYA